MHCVLHPVLQSMASNTRLRRDKMTETRMWTEGESESQLRWRENIMKQAALLHEPLHSKGINPPLS